MQGGYFPREVYLVHRPLDEDWDAPASLAIILLEAMDTRPAAFHLILIPISAWTRFGNLCMPNQRESVARKPYSSVLGRACAYCCQEYILSRQL